MKKLIYITIASLSLAIISCDKDFEEINTSPNDSPITDPNLLLSSTIIQTQNVLYNAQIGGDMGLCWAQQWSKVQYNTEEKYTPRRANMNSFWSVLYANVIAEATNSYQLAGSSNSNIQGAALVMKANALQILTDVYGPVPVTEIGISGNTKPKFDSQEVVYDSIINLLDRANSKFNVGSGAITPSADLLYAGNTSKWKKFANSLKLKVLMRISSKRDVSAQIQALVDSGSLMDSNSDSAQLIYTASQPDANPIYETIVFGTRKEYKVSSVLIAKLNSLNDPRLSVFAGKNNVNNYVGNIPGVENPSNYAAFSSPGPKYLSATLPGVILSYAQVQLFLAEAANSQIISGGINASINYLKKGIQANLEYNEIAPGTTTLYIDQVAVNFTNSSLGKEIIGTQMWLALYGQGIETWTEWRRTGIPSLSPVENADPTVGVIPRRFYFSTDSQNYNNANYVLASSTLSDGDTMKSKVWWMN